MKKAYVLFDVDNTLYPRSSGLGKAMGDRIVDWVRTHVDLSGVDPAKLPGAREIEESQAYNHPPDIDPSDELVEKLSLHYYKMYGLTIVGLVKNQGVSRELEQSYLDYVHEPSARIETYMPHKHEHVATVNLMEKLGKVVPLYLFSNAHQDHVDRILEHLSLPADWFQGCLEYYQMREHCKPQPQSYQMMIDMVRQKHPDAKPEDMIFFDDAKVNLKAAKAFGFRTVLVHDGHEQSGAERPAYIDAMLDDVRNTVEMRRIMADFGIAMD